MNRQPSYLLHRTGGSLYFRISVPQELRPLLRKREIKQPIILQDYDHARASAAELAYTWKLVFSKMRECMGKGNRPPELKLILRDLLLDPKSGTTKVGAVEFDPENLDQELEALGKHLPGLGQSGTTEAEQSLLLEVIEAYCTEREVGGTWGPKTAESNRKMFEELVEIFGDVPIASIDKQKARGYKETLLQLPPNYRKKAEYDGLGIDQIIALKPPEKLSTKTVNIRILELPRFRGRFIACAIMKCFSNHSASNRIPKARAVRSAW